MSSLRARLAEPVDGASLGVFRIALGLSGVVAVARFFSHGWIDEYYVKPRWFFPYWGFSWVRPWPAPWMNVHYAVIALAALALAVGLRPRLASAVLALSFGYAHLCDKSNYLTHYYLVTLLAGIGAVVPWSRFASCAPGAAPSTVPRWALWLLRFQLGVVYVYGAIGKIGVDWLWHAQPLRTWLAANAELPLLGRLFHLRATALAFAWGGFLFDLCIAFLLSWKRTRRPAYLLVLAFHVTTALLFRIGMFPWMMIVFTPVFFDPSWPRRGRARIEAVSAQVPSGRPLSAGALALLAGYALLQIAMPLRSALYPGNTLWSEEGFRFAWKVMLIEKSGELELVVDDRLGRRTYVDARDHLTPIQLRMVVTQPDMILQFAHFIAEDYAARGLGPVQIRAHAEVSFNARSHAPLIDPTVDLAPLHDGLAPKPWIAPAPSGPPAF